MLHSLMNRILFSSHVSVSVSFTCMLSVQGEGGVMTALPVIVFIWRIFLGTGIMGELSLPSLLLWGMQIFFQNLHHWIIQNILCFSFSGQLIWIDTFQSSFNVTLFVVVGDRFLLYSSGWPPILDPPASAPPMLEFSHPTTMMPFSLCELKQNSLGESHWLLKMVLMGRRESESTGLWVQTGGLA